MQVELLQRIHTTSLCSRPCFVLKVESTYIEVPVFSNFLYFCAIDPKKSIPFYTQNFGFKLLHFYHFPESKFSLYFLGILETEESCKDWPEPGTKEAEKALWTMRGSCLELTHNHGSESDETFAVNNGNVEPHRGFGHIAVMTPDVAASAAELEHNQVAFKKRPEEGKMKCIAFALDPDNYWIEIIPRGDSSPAKSKYTLAQTMLRVKDPVPSIRFYSDLLRMSLLKESHFEDFSLYFLAHLPPGTPLPEKDSPEASEYIRNMFPQVLELTHNHGTEKDPDFAYHNGNDQDKGQLRGFGHTGFLVDDLEASCSYLEKEGSVRFKKRPEEGSMRGLAFALDPDNYWVEIIQRNGLSLSK